ncbi:MAG: hypothetical protein SXQ77_07965, partial [Halobacteria archaeon]|nr:hypothetical protein [Halobacteria archaeon]
MSDQLHPEIPSMWSRVLEWTIFWTPGIVTVALLIGGLLSVVMQDGWAIAFGGGYILIILASFPIYFASL